MPTPIKMPALSPTMEEGTLAKWLVKPGDSISAGDIMAEIETDKATMEFEAVDEGTIASIEVEEGSENVAVGTVIAMLAEEGEDLEEAAKAAPSSDSAPTPAPASEPAAAPTLPCLLLPHRPRHRHRPLAPGIASSHHPWRSGLPNRMASISRRSRARAPAGGS